MPNICQRICSCTFQLDGSSVCHFLQTPQESFCLRAKSASTSSTCQHGLRFSTPFSFSPFLFHCPLSRPCCAHPFCTRSACGRKNEVKCGERAKGRTSSSAQSKGLWREVWWRVSIAKVPPHQTVGGSAAIVVVVLAVLVVYIPK